MKPVGRRLEGWSSFAAGCQHAAAAGPSGAFAAAAM